eukprot:COSAG05_NODE_56_length_23335_cov_15.221338_10_plen_57_part_00
MDFCGGVPEHTFLLLHVLLSIGKRASAGVHLLHGICRAVVMRIMRHMRAPGVEVRP